MKEKCIRCGRDTEYELFTPIIHRRYFVEGSGQLCKECWNAVYGEPTVQPSVKDTEGKTNYQ